VLCNLGAVFMPKETEVILRSILFQALTNEDIEDIRDAIKAMCSEEDIAMVEQRINQMKARKKQSRSSRPQGRLISWEEVFYVCRSSNNKSSCRKRREWNGCF